MTQSEIRLTAVFETVEHGWVQGRIRELPGVITAAPDRAEAEEGLLDALREYLLASAGDSQDESGASVEELRLQVVLSGQGMTG